MNVDMAVLNEHFKNGIRVSTKCLQKDWVVTLQVEAQHFRVHVSKMVECWFQVSNVLFSLN